MKIIMRYHFLLFVFIVSGLMAFTTDQAKYSPIKGEQVTYTIQLGDGIVGEATLAVSQQLHNFNNHTCFKAEVEGKSVGVVGMVSKIHNKFNSYIDVQSLQPQRFIMHVSEGNYQRHEETKFRATQAVKVNLDDPAQTATYQVPYNVQDLVSAYYYVRSLPFATYQVGSLHTFPVFFDGQLINAQFKYLGKTTTNTRFGKKSAYLLQPLLPPNPRIKNNSVRLWIADDATHLPLKVYAKLDNTYARIDLKRYKKGQ